MSGAQPTIQGSFNDLLARRADRPAIGFADIKGNIDWLTTAAFQRESAVKAAWLRDKGLGRGDAAVLVTADQRFAATAVCGILQLGAVPLLVAPPAIQGVNSNLEAVIRHVVGLTEARQVLLPPEMEQAAATIAEQYPDTIPVVGSPPDEIEAPDDPPIVVPDAVGTAALQLTSGTTGFPRVCVWRHANVFAAIEGMTKAMQLSEEEIHANWTPLYHDMGLVNNFLLCLISGIPLVLINPLDFIRRPVLWLQIIHDARATMTWAPNFGYAVAAQRIRDSELEGIRLDHAKGFWNAGEKVHIATFEAFHRRFKGIGLRWEALKANFGCAENVGGATFTGMDEAVRVERLQSAQLYEERRAVIAGDDYDGATERVVSTGRGHPALKVHILDEAGAPLPDGSVGEVALESPSRLIEFMGQPDESAEVIKNNYVLTGDLGYLRGGELFWVGRKRERINLAGVKHDPSDFEALLNDIDGLRKGCFAAFGVEDESIGTQRLYLVCEVVNDVKRPLDEICDENRQEVATRLGVTVAEVALVEKGMLTKTSSGKRRHLHFRNLYLGGGLPVLHSVSSVR
jgi:acyl-CoA synthetase (AMP-forming)/AMP-acid ligase II